MNVRDDAESSFEGEVQRQCCQGVKDDKDDGHYACMGVALSFEDLDRVVIDDDDSFGQLGFIRSGEVSDFMMDMINGEGVCLLGVDKLRFGLIANTLTQNCRRWFC
jgi:hypothetical protein